MCLKETNLRPHNMMTILGSIIHIIGGGGGSLFVHLIWIRMVTLIMTKVFI